VIKKVNSEAAGPCRETKPMEFVLNGEVHHHDGDGTLAELLKQCRAERARTAVMVNGEVVRKGEMDNFRLHDGDRVELIVIAAGG
jgi:thiamine biosynthesis protein ThiS